MTPLFRRRLLILALVMGAFLIGDQLTKFLAVKHLTPVIRDAVAKSEIQPGLFSELKYFYSDKAKDPCRGRVCEEVDVVDGFWSFHYRENRGAAFSMLAKVPDWARIPFFVCSTLIALGVIGLYLKRIGPEKKVLAAALILVAGGAVGNLLDRLYLGYVIDFIHWYVGNYSWPTFNVADSAISVGAVLLAIDALFSKDGKTAKNGAGTGKAATAAD